MRTSNRSSRKKTKPNVPSSSSVNTAAPVIATKPEPGITAAAPAAAAGTLEAAPAAAPTKALEPNVTASAVAAADPAIAAPAAAKAPELEVTPAVAAADPAIAAPAAAKAPDAAASATKTTDPAATGEPVFTPNPDIPAEPVTPVPASTADAQSSELVAPAPTAQEPADAADELAKQPPDGEHDAEPADPDSDNATNPIDPNCTIYASPFSSADLACYVPVEQPQLSQIAKAVLHAPVDAILDGGAELIVDAFKATGNDKLVAAALAESLTPDQANLLSTVMTDPKVNAEVDILESKLSKVITTGIDEVEKTVLPPLQTAIGEAVGGIVESALAELDDILPFGAVRGAIQAVNTAAKGFAAGEKAIDGLQEAVAPVKQVMSEVGDLTAAMNEAAAKAEGAASNAEGAASNAEGAASNAVAGAEDAASSEASSAEGVATSAASGAASGAASNAVAGSEAALPAPQFTKGDTPDKGPFGTPKLTKQEKKDENNQLGGGSRKRRHIHKLSRRIERTLRRVQKKYGLKDKNDFLRRTLHSRKK